MFDAENLRQELFKLRDEAYRDFQAKIVPNVAKEKFIGIRTPDLVRFVKKYFREVDAKDFLNDLPHKYFEENSIHALLISKLKDFDACLSATKTFLPYVDNWATCDSISPKIFKQHASELDAEISNWLAAIGSENYYVQMAAAWLFATALAKHFDATIKFLTEEKLSPRIKNLTIRKALESRRITAEQKIFLRGLRV